MAIESAGSSELRVGLMGVNTSHAGAFARILNEKKAIPGARLTWVWGGELRADQPDAATLAERYSIERIAGEPMECLPDTDLVLVVDDTGQGGNHVPLARPFVQAGIPTFVDKPMSLSVSEARSLFTLAERTKTPVTSSSALRYAKEVAEQRDAIASLGKLSSITSVGPGEWYYYGVHAVEQLFLVTGSGVEWVQRFSWPSRDVAVLSYGDGGPTAVVQTLRDAKYTFELTLYGENGKLAIEIADFDAFYTRQVEAAVEMARTRRAPIEPAETLELLAVLAAGELSGERGGARVDLSEVQ